MLHKIEVPDCCKHLYWVTELQSRLLNALCQPVIKGEAVTETWVIAKLQELGIESNWIKGFCRRKDRVSNIGKSVLEHMRIIASFPVETKETVLAAFYRDQQFSVAFHETDPHPQKLFRAAFLDEEKQQNAIRGFFESFYAPTFYKNAGYRIPGENGSFIHFHRDVFVEGFKSKNKEIAVCPTCDGDLGSPELDHFYPRSRYPFLSCHPYNLVPICKSCNYYKRERPPLNEEDQDPMASWFHPYLRSAEGKFTLVFERMAGGTTLGFANSGDTLTHTRLENLEKLYDLRSRWRQALSRKVKATIRKVEKWRGAKGSPLSKEELVDKLQNLADDADAEIGLIAFALVNYYYLHKVAEGEAFLFDELWVCNSGADPVTAE